MQFSYSSSAMQGALQRPASWGRERGWDGAPDVQTRVVAELEDAYWHEHFAARPYYVAGRGYDQYQPAFALGGKWALQNPDASFEDMERQLEQDWLHQRSSSLLSWHEVRVAVQEAWSHALAQRQAMQQAPLTAVSASDIAKWITPLQSNSAWLAMEFKRLSRLSMGSFVCEVVNRHARMLNKFSRQLARLGVTQFQEPPITNLWVNKLRRRWKVVQWRLRPADPAPLFDVCEHKERVLLHAYEVALKQELPVAVLHLLELQTKELRRHFDKLVWVRRNWQI